MSKNEQNWYQENYNSVNATAIEGNIAYKILHKSLERPYRSNYGFNILEIGSNVGEHIKFVKNDWKFSGTYLATDKQEISADALEYVESLGAKFITQDVTSLQLNSNYFDRVILTCVLHHVSEPEIALKEVRRVTKPGGKIDIFLPNDPGIMYRYLRKKTTVRNAKKRGILNLVEYTHAKEHRNHFLSLKILAEKVFENDNLKISSYPFFIDSYNINAFTILRIEKQHM